MKLVLKIGGSIFEKSSIFSTFFHSFHSSINTSTSYIIIMGGGHDCDKLREKYRTSPEKKNKDDYYHWKAIKIMGKNARELKKQVLSYSNITLISSPDDVDESGIFFLQPYQDLRKKDPLSHSWDVTSDSIAVYYANELKSPLAVLIKYKPFLLVDRIPIRRISTSKLIEYQKEEQVAQNLGKGFVDPICPHLSLKFKIPILILDGTDKGIITKFFSTNPMGKTDLSSYGIEIYPE